MSETAPGGSVPRDEDETPATPGYQPTERLDRAALAAAVSERTDTSGTSDPRADPQADPQADEHEPNRAPEGPPILTDAAKEQHRRDTEEIVSRLPSPVPAVRAPEREVTVVDLPIYRLRRPGDLVTAIGAALGIVLVLLLAVFAHATTEGVTQDVTNALPTALRAFLLAPVNLLEGVVTFLLPIAIIIDRLVRRQARLVGEAAAASLAAILLTLGGIWLLDNVASVALVDGVTTVTLPATSFVPIIASLAAFLTITGSTERRRIVGWTWNLLWLTIVLQVLRGGMTLPGALASVLAGRMIGLLVRYLTGVLGDRAYGSELVRAMRRCGIDPERVLRIVDGRPVEGAKPTVVLTDGPIGYLTDEGDEGESAQQRHEAEAVVQAQVQAQAQALRVHGAGAHRASDPSGVASADERERLTTTWDFSTELPRITDPLATPAGKDDSPGAPEAGRPPLRTATAVIGEQEGENRIYSVRDSGGKVWDVGVLDGDRQVVGMLSTIWSTLRLRGLSHRTVVSLRASAERTALMSYAAAAAGVRTPHLRGLATEQDSALLVSEHISGTQTFADVQTRRLTDEVLDRIWQEVRTAHTAGLAHRNLDDQAILLDGEDRVWLTGWASGEMSSAPLARRLDLAHVLALLALRVGAERAMASAARNLTSDELEAIAPIFQPVAMPERTRADARAHKATLAAVQELLVGMIPTAADVPAVQMRRFSARTVITVTVAAVALFFVLTSFNISEMIGFVKDADPAYLAIAFVLGLLTYVGSAMGLVAFSPVKLSLWRTSLVQVAASLVGLVAPAGVGPAALNLRFMQKNKLDTPMAVTTVALVQVSQFVTTILLLLGIALVTGSSGALDTLPSGSVLIVVLVVVAIVGVLLAFPAIRRWAIAKVMPTLRQIWPRLVWVVGRPGRLLTAIAGNLIMTVGYIAAFGFTLAAFGESLPLASLTIVYLAGNAAGSAVPTPGGIGTIELALTTGLRTFGVASAVALSTSFVFRLLTFWIRIPLGWLALRYLQKRNLV